MTKICKIHGCENKIKARGMCSKHYQKFMKYGDPTHAKQERFKGALKDRIMFGVERDNATGCWNWKRATVLNGYGYININGINIGTHRASYITFKGEIPKGMSVCHKCDNPACCNPEHLFLGTQGDNIRDMHKKNRAVILHGEKSCNSKINKKDAIIIYVMKFLGVKAKSLSGKFNVSIGQIRNIQNKKYWQRELDDIDVLYGL